MKGTKSEITNIHIHVPLKLSEKLHSKKLVIVLSINAY